MAEESFLSDVTKKEPYGKTGIIVHVLLANGLSKALNTKIPFDDGKNECGIPVGSEVSVIVNSPLPSKIDAKECRNCKFTTALGARLPLVCNIYHYNR